MQPPPHWHKYGSPHHIDMNADSPLLSVQPDSCPSAALEETGRGRDERQQIYRRNSCLHGGLFNWKSRLLWWTKQLSNGSAGDGTSFYTGRRVNRKFSCVLYGACPAPSKAASISIFYGPRRSGIRWGPQKIYMSKLPGGPSETGPRAAIGPRAGLWTCLVYRLFWFILV